ncbi:class I SAM-dependent methyltransferase [Magnetospirillum sp. 15-1]|uniref:class I SAM-dependent methyltransferase n=1 Tax=Magnetospirillum sp. 15-1 TaxID=1979370 RepID=UPI000BBB81E3|nr:class I SAM-dependent methyltransferase [Magnetospirillum sp. 15-1]
MTGPVAPPSQDDLPLGQRLSEHELCPDDLLAGQEAAFARDIVRLHQHDDQLVAVACPACGTDRPDHAFAKFGFAFQRCPECRTVYMSPRPSEALMADYYANSENYAYWAEHIFPASEDTRREKIHKPWLARVAEYCDRFGIDRGTLLEVGPGFGTFSSVATQSGAFRRVVAVEPTPEMAAACRQRGVEVIEKRIEDLDGAVDRADVVCAFEVIEHLFEPARFVRGIRNVVAPGGLLILSCPNGEGFDMALLGGKALAVDAEHVNLFNPDSLSRLVRDAGFEILSVQTPGRLDAELVRDAALAGDIVLDPFLQRVLVDEWERLGWPFQHFLAENGLSSHMWLAARRPE